MLKISKTKREPFWLDASSIRKGVRFHLKPALPADVIVARGFSGDAIEEVAKTDPSNERKAVADGSVAFARALVKLCLIGWEGIADDETGEAVEPTPDLIDIVLDMQPIFDLLYFKFVNPALLLAEEKNASSPSQNGTSGARTPDSPIAETVQANASSVPTE